MEIENSKTDASTGRPSSQTSKPKAEQLSSWPKRLLWFIAIWAMGIITLSAVTYFLRLLMKLP